MQAGAPQGQATEIVNCHFAGGIHADPAPEQPLVYRNCTGMGVKLGLFADAQYRLEQQRIGAWLEHIKALATKPGGYDAAVELAECQRLVKGYSDTHERGLKNYAVVTDAVRRLA